MSLLRSVLGLVALQGVLAGAYLLIQRARAPGPSFTVEALAEPAPPLDLEASSRARVAVATGRWRLLHFWATTCPPCRRELPGLLALGSEIDVLAISTDPGWPEIEAFFGGAAPPQVVRLVDPAGFKRLGGSALPDTYLLSPRGRLVARFAGARDWTSAAAQARLRKEMSR